VLTSAVGDASKLCSIVLFMVSGQAPCSGAKRQGKGIDEVSTTFHGDSVAMKRGVELQKTWESHGRMNKFNTNGIWICRLPANFFSARTFGCANCLLLLFLFKIALI